jgi:hypothetical protein
MPGDARIGSSRLVRRAAEIEEIAPPASARTNRACRISAIMQGVVGRYEQQGHRSRESAPDSPRRAAHANLRRGGNRRRGSPHRDHAGDRRSELRYAPSVETPMSAQVRRVAKANRSDEPSASRGSAADPIERQRDDGIDTPAQITSERKWARRRSSENR